MKKRIISLGLSLAMVLTSANSIFAEEVTINTPEGTTVNQLPYTSSISSSTATGSGTIKYLDKDITIVTLPTSNLNFEMDPQGIVGATKAVSAVTDAAEKQSKFTAALKDNAGKIYGTNVLSIKNEGANQVEVGVSLVASAERTDAEKVKTQFITAAPDSNGDPQFGSATATDVTPTDTSLSEDVFKANNIALEAVFTKYNADSPSNGTTDESAGEIVYVGKKSESTVTLTNKIEKVVDPYDSNYDANIKDKASFDENGSKLTFQFEEDTTYGIKSDGSAYESGINGLDATQLAYTGPKTKGTSVGFRISGSLNKNADWSDYAGTPKETVKINAIYEVKKLNAGTVSKDAVGKDAELSALSGTGLGVVEAADLSANIEFTLTRGILDTSVASLDSSVAPTINGTAIAIGRYNTAADYYEFNGNKVTIKPLAFTAVGATIPCTVEVKDTDGNTYTGKVVTP